MVGGVDGLGFGGWRFFLTLKNGLENLRQVEKLYFINKNMIIHNIQSHFFLDDT